MNDTALDYQKLLTDALQKQMLILGPQITLIKAHNVEGLSVSNDGRVTNITGDPKAVSIKLMEEFRELSPTMVKKTMQPLLSSIIATYPHPAAEQEPEKPVHADAQEPKDAEQQESELKHTADQAHQEHEEKPEVPDETAHPADEPKPVN